MSIAAKLWAPAEPGSTELFLHVGEALRRVGLRLLEAALVGNEASPEVFLLWSHSHCGYPAPLLPSARVFIAVLLKD